MVTDRGLTRLLGKKSDRSDSVASLGSEGMWRTLFEAVDCGLLILSEPHQVIVEANSAICDRWQIPREELLGLSLRHVVASQNDDSTTGQMMRGPITGSEVRWRLQSIGDAATMAWVAIFGGPAAEKPGADPSRGDSLTSLPNRQFLEEELARRLRKSTSSRKPFALLFLDLDGFKAVNDQWGHLAGDDILREVGRRLAGSVREKDIVARYGGDEFVILAEGIATARDAARLAKRITAALSLPYSLANSARRGASEVQIGVSIGLALADSAASSARTLLEKADRDMYRRKRLRQRRRALQESQSQRN